ncbi:BlaI/MecI/CopY family transcriptional regulator [Riemerella columbina]|uniref:BlaI/MecI/CopY family transcriptional regulator n=1 Tax=Riemerella columbina TaxID=103810 RepID=UPI0026708773|nr:BlaI/MecI/CopY family transcriptional regulator [Riemerella columbina]WKS94524.1 BlaI/MecI/CopY family transcriptional regulator [Riemerella columbina]
MIQALTTMEEQVMQVIWELQGAFLRDIIEAFPEPKPHQNTVSTYVKILTEKGFVSIEKHGRVFFYKIEISKQEYRIFLLKNLVENYYQNETKELLNRLLKEHLIDKKEVLKTAKKLKKKG